RARRSPILWPLGALPRLRFRWRRRRRRVAPSVDGHTHLHLGAEGARRHAVRRSGAVMVRSGPGRPAHGTDEAQGDEAAHDGPSVVDGASISGRRSARISQRMSGVAMNVDTMAMMTNLVNIERGKTPRS